MVDVCKVVLNGECAAELKEIPLSNNTISEKANKISKDIKAQFLGRPSKTHFTIQLDESSDIASQAQLHVMLLGKGGGGGQNESFMFRHLMQCRTASFEFFNFAIFYNQNCRGSDV